MPPAVLDLALNTPAFTPATLVSETRTPRSISEMRKKQLFSRSPEQKNGFVRIIALFPFQPARCFARIHPVKFAASLLLLSAFAFTACNNLVTRRSTYRPAKGSGPYSEARRTGKLPTQEQLAAARATPRPTAGGTTTEELGLPPP